MAKNGSVAEVTFNFPQLSTLLSLTFHNTHWYPEIQNNIATKDTMNNRLNERSEYLKSGNYKYMYLSITYITFHNIN